MTAWFEGADAYELTKGIAAANALMAAMPPGWRFLGLRWREAAEYNDGYEPEGWEAEAEGPLRSASHICSVCHREHYVGPELRYGRGLTIEEAILELAKQVAIP